MKNWVMAAAISFGCFTVIVGMIILALISKLGALMVIGLLLATIPVISTITIKSILDDIQDCR